MAFKMRGFTAFTKNKDKETKEDRLTKSMKLHEREDKDTFVPKGKQPMHCLLYTSPSPRDQRGSRIPACA